MSHMNESCHIWMGHFTYECVMSHMNASCHMWIRHVTWMRHVTCKWVMSHIWMGHVTCEWVKSHVNESCLSYDWVMFSVNESYYMGKSQITCEESCHIWMSHVTCKWVMSHMWMRHVTCEWVMSLTCMIQFPPILSLSPVSIVYVGRDSIIHVLVWHDWFICEQLFVDESCHTYNWVVSDICNW